MLFDVRDAGIRLKARLCTGRARLLPAEVPRTTLIMPV